MLFAVFCSGTDSSRHSGFERYALALQWTMNQRRLLHAGPKPIGRRSWTYMLALICSSERLMLFSKSAYASSNNK